MSCFKIFDIKHRYILCSIMIMKFFNEVLNLLSSQLPKIAQGSPTGSTANALRNGVVDNPLGAGD